MHNPNVQTAFSAAGTTISSFSGSTTSLNANQGSVTVKLKDGRKNSTLEVMNDLRTLPTVGLPVRNAPMPGTVMASSEELSDNP